VYVTFSSLAAAVKHFCNRKIENLVHWKSSVDKHRDSVKTFTYLGSLGHPWAEQSREELGDMSVRLCGRI
jgi:hypothetical protein